MKIINIFIYPFFFLFNHISFRTILPKKFRRYFDFIRTKLLSVLGAKIGKKVFISENFFCISYNNLELDCNGTIGMNCEFYSYDKIKIGSNFLIGSNVIIHTAEHIFCDSSKPIIEQGSIYSPVTIGSNVYIGSNVIILAGVTIGDNVIIGAGGVVMKNLESGYIYGGNPVKKIKKLYNEKR